MRDAFLWFTVAMWVWMFCWGVCLGARAQVPPVVWFLALSLFLCAGFGLGVVVRMALALFRGGA